jgi:purine-binding chemotaxis protein CheW
MSMIVAPTQTMLVFVSLAHRCALPAHDVAEIMRPQPVSPVASAPAFVDGLAVIRGSPVPVLSLARLLDPGSQEQAARLIIVRIGSRSVALAVAAVSGMKAVPGGRLSDLPPLLSAAGAAAVTSLALLDHELILVLELARILSDELWAELLARAPA